ncbi:MAG: hypothetical protein GXO77_11930 [Calditrichaeota bacterium]|nr:hypothetical protein [Calditrichota bacterium]
MQVKPKYLAVFSGVLFLAALIVHLLLFWGMHKIPYFLDVLLTAGMVIAWVFSSKILRQIQNSELGMHPVRLLTQNAPNWLVGITGFFLFYAVVNLGMMIRTNWTGSNLRGVSGFWLFFYSFALVVSLARIRQLRIHAGDNDQEHDRGN